MSENTEVEVVTCANCSNEVSLDDSYSTYDNEYACQDCLRVCENCEATGHEGWEWHTVGGDTWCNGCYEHNSWWCDHCEENCPNSWDSYSVSNDTWCESCVDNDASYCDSCDERYNGRRFDECPNCNEADRVGSIHEYSYKPNPIFHGSTPNNLYMGFELEMELNNVPSGLAYSGAVSAVMPLETDSVCYLKSDSSINGRGFELVTHPHTLEAYDKQAELWHYIEYLRKTYGARSWDTDSCGLHVHVSRTAFRGGAHTHRWLSFIYKNPKVMMKLAGRKNSRYASFADVYVPDEWGIPRFSLTNKLRQSWNSERYSAVNTNNDYTLELRFFRGTMKREGIMSALELCHASVEYTRNLSLSDVKMGALGWEWFAEWVDANNGMYPNLYVRMSKVRTENIDNRPILNA